MQCRFVKYTGTAFCFLSHSYAWYALPGTVHTQNKTGIFNAFLLLHMGGSAFPHQPEAVGPPFLSRTGNYRFLAFVGALVF